MDTQKFALITVAALLPPHSDKRNRTTAAYRQWETELGVDLKKRGMRSPIRVIREGDRFRVLAGETRRRAALLAGMEKVPVIALERDLTPGEVLREQILENEMRRNFNDRERFEAYAELMNVNGWSTTELAHEIGKPLGTVVKILAPCTKLPEDLLALMGRGDGQIGPRAAYQLSRVHPNLDYMRELADRHVKGVLKVEALEAAVVTYLGKKPKRDKTLKLAAGGVVALVKGNPLESLKVFLAKVNEAIKRIEKDNLPPDFLSGLVK